MKALKEFIRKSFVNFCRNHRDKTEVPGHLVVEDLISYKLNNRRKISKADFTVQEYIFQYFGSSGCYKEVITNLKYGKYDITSEKMNNNKRLIDRAN